MTFWALLDSRPWFCTLWLLIIVVSFSLLFLVWIDFYPHGKK